MREIVLLKFGSGFFKCGTLLRYYINAYNNISKGVNFSECSTTNKAVRCQKKLLKKYPNSPTTSTLSSRTSSHQTPQTLPNNAPKPSTNSSPKQETGISLTVTFTPSVRTPQPSMLVLF
jgi:hypothetical protein